MTQLLVALIGVVLVLLWIVFLIGQAKAANALHLARLEERRIRLREQPVRPISYTRWSLEGPSDSVLYIVPAFFILVWLEIEILPYLVAPIALVIVYLRSLRTFELVVEGTIVRWGWTNRRDRQQLVNLRKTLLIEYRSESGGEAGTTFTLAYFQEDGTSGCFPNASDEKFVREFLRVVNEVRPGVAEDDVRDE